MIWFIGGPARCGKSTLKRQARPLAEGEILSWDILKPALHALATGNDRDSLLARIDDTKISTEKWIELLRRRDRVVWKVVKTFAEIIMENNNTSIIEGNVWPDFLTELPSELDYRAVFLVDTSPTHADRIVEIARDHSSENNWMHNWTDEHLRHWAGYNIERSREITRLGHKHNQAIFDIADGGLDSAQERALDHLTSS